MMPLEDAKKYLANLQFLSDDNKIGLKDHNVDLKKLFRDKEFNNALLQEDFLQSSVKAIYLSQMSNEGAQKNLQILIKENKFVNQVVRKTLQHYQKNMPADYDLKIATITLNTKDIIETLSPNARLLTRPSTWLPWRRIAHTLFPGSYDRNNKHRIYYGDLTSSNLVDLCLAQRYFTIKSFNYLFEKKFLGQCLASKIKKDDWRRLYEKLDKKERKNLAHWIIKHPKRSNAFKSLSVEEVVSFYMPRGDRRADRVVEKLLVRLGVENVEAKVAEAEDNINELRGDYSPIISTTPGAVPAGYFGGGVSSPGFRPIAFGGRSPSPVEFNSDEVFLTPSASPLPGTQDTTILAADPNTWQEWGWGWIKSISDGWSFPIQDKANQPSSTATRNHFRSSSRISMGSVGSMGSLGSMGSMASVRDLKRSRSMASIERVSNYSLFSSRGPSPVQELRARPISVPLHPQSIVVRPFSPTPNNS